LDASRFNSDQAGFSLLEVVVATALLAGGMVSLAQLFAVATTSNTNARTSTFATVLAEQKMEQLRGLTWGFDTIGLPLSDTTSNTAGAVPAPTGGAGLSPSPASSLTTSAAGYVDYLDQFGNVIGGGSTIPNGTMYIRRWSIEPLPTNPNNTLILQVLVTTRRNRGTADTGSVARLTEEARLISVKTRKST
jgi:prepilin-type N-terminal cleavage/methylation domain-containing protein